MKRFFVALVAAAAVVHPAWADDDAEKARDDAVFGEDDGEVAQPSATKPVVASPKDASPTASGEGEVVDLGDERVARQSEENKALLSRDRTQIGGFFYMRTSAGLAEGQKVSDIGLGNTTLFDAYFDSRINDRLRVYSRGRINYNPLADAPATSLAIPGLSLGPQNTDEVRVVLNQMWIKFDIGQRVFVTAGRQFVRFGATRFWNPVDVINNIKFNPLAFFDDRVGPTMLKFHLPIESKGWNFYGILLTENAAKVDSVGAVLRSEIVLGQAELGLVGALRKGQDPKIGADLSAGIGVFDLTAEIATWFPDAANPQWQASAGLSYSWAYGEDDTLVLGVEYFHNDQGVTAQTYLDSTLANAKLGKSSPYVPLFTGRDYAGLVATVLSPGDWNNSSVSLIGLSNLTDKSGTAQINFSTRVLTDLTVEAFTAANFGDGEFRGYIPMIKEQLPQQLPGGLGQSLADQLQAPMLRIGLNLRCDL